MNIDAWRRTAGHKRQTDRDYSNHGDVLGLASERLKVRGCGFAGTALSTKSINQRWILPAFRLLQPEIKRRQQRRLSVASVLVAAGRRIGFRWRRYWFGTLCLSLVLHLFVWHGIHGDMAPRPELPGPLPMVEVSLIPQAASKAKAPAPSADKIQSNDAKPDAFKTRSTEQANDFVPQPRKARRHETKVRKNRDKPFPLAVPVRNATAPVASNVAAAPVLTNELPELPVELPHYNANYLHNPKPIYPEVAWRNGVQGRVLLRILVNPDGHCEFVEIERSSGHDVLDNSALEAVKDWRFIPAKRGEQAVTSLVTVPILFQIES